MGTGAATLAGLGIYNHFWSSSKSEVSNTVTYEVDGIEDYVGKIEFAKVKRIYSSEDPGWLVNFKDEEFIVRIFGDSIKDLEKLEVIMMANAVKKSWKSFEGGQGVEITVNIDAKLR